MRFLLFIFLPLITFSQTIDSNNLKVYLKTDISYASSAADTRKEAQSATGTLGIKFEKNYLFGSAVFTIHSQNEQISTDDDSERKLFGTNLLLPQNSSSNISNFELNLGTDSFFRKKTDEELTGSKFSKKIHKLAHPLGFQLNWRVNNTIWQKSQLSTPVTISSLSVDLTYKLLDATMEQFSSEKIRLTLGIGYCSRRLGGDFGLNENEDLRLEFLGTKKLSFDGFKLSTRLEVSKFFGQIDLTTFSKKQDIKGFSGDQAVITIGVRADLGLPTKVK